MTPALIVRKLRSELAGPFEITLASGDCATIIGPSGSGKSLFLRMIADLDPNEGEVWLNDRERTSMPAPAWRKAGHLCLRGIRLVGRQGHRTFSDQRAEQRRRAGGAPRPS